MTFNPIEAKRLARWTKHELDDFFKGPGRIVQEVREKNPSLYKEYRDAYEAMGGIGKSLQPSPAPNVPYKPPTRTYTAEELVARGQYSETEIRNFFNSKEANEVFTSDRNEYERKREAGVSYGLFKAREVPYVPTKPPEPEYLQRISDELADESGLPRGTSVPWGQFEQLCSQKVQRARKVQEDAAAKLEADRQAELAQLTKAQQLEQAARDRHQADLDRLVELTAPTPSIVPEPAQLATARVIAQEKAKAA